MAYSYKELFSQMRPSMVSPWTNNWFDIYDFTPHKRADEGTPNFYCVPDVEPNFMRPLEEAKEIINKARLARGTDVKTLAEVDSAEFEQLQLEIEVEVP